eukprot:scaffold145933_cov27-Prasinocladus_malaysianus.AAC.1
MRAFTYGFNEAYVAQENGVPTVSLLLHRTTILNMQRGSRLWILNTMLGLIAERLTGINNAELARIKAGAHRLTNASTRRKFRLS